MIDTPVVRYLLLDKWCRFSWGMACPGLILVGVWLAGGAIADEPTGTRPSEEATVIPDLFADEKGERSPDLNTQAEEVAAHLRGVMDTSAQAIANSDVVPVRMTTCEVGVDGIVPEGYESAVFLYQEQALMRNLEQPYRQRFLAIAPDPGTQSIQSITFNPPEPEQWVGLCDRPDDTRQVQVLDLGEEICRVFLRPHKTGYIGRTPVGGCPTEVRGAVAITNVIVLHSTGMDTWDRGYDAAGNQVWGARATPYQFRWSDIGSD